MVRVAGCFVCAALLLALPSLRALCADSCPPEVVAQQPPCHDDHGGQPATPADAPASCAHGDALATTAARIAPDGPAEPGPTATLHAVFESRPPAARPPLQGAGLHAAAQTPARHQPPLRC